MPSDQSDGSGSGTGAATGDDAYRQLANALPQVIWTCDPHGNLDWVNDTWTELTGLSREATLASKGGLTAVHPDDWAQIDQRFGSALTSGAPCEIDYRIRNRAGEYRYHFCRVVPMRDAAGAITRWVAAAFDIHDRRQAEAGLRASERRFETVFEQSPQPIAISRLSDGVLVDVNDAFLRMTGFTRGEVVGQSMVSLGMWSEAERATHVAPLHQRPKAQNEILFRAKRGQSLILSVTSTRVDFGGELCLVHAILDVTVQRAAEAAVQRSEAAARARLDELEALMDAVPAVVWVTRDAACKEAHGNGAGRRILGLAEGQNMSKTSSDPSGTDHFKVFVNGVEPNPHDLPLQTAARGVEVRNHEEEIRFDDGRRFYLYGNAVPLRDPQGRPRGAVGAFVDITRLKEVEAALLEADRRKDEFLALLSHELRNPLAPILVATQLMQWRGDVATPNEREVIRNQAEHLMRLVDDLLDVSRVSRGKITLNKLTLELASVVAKAVEVTAPLFEERHHRLKVSVPATGLLIHADTVRMTQVITNLLTNAARYTPTGGLVEVRAVREGDQVLLRVRDNGVGIAPELLPRMFDTFVQGPRGPDRAEGGLGLGLSLARSLTNLHGGKISAHSDGAGRGSEMVVRLPVAAARVASAIPVERILRAPPLGVPGKRVLLVDDNQQFARLLSTVLVKAGHQVQVANDPSVALAMADEFRPQVAILDIGLPVMDGYTLGRELRARHADDAPLLVALTGYGQAQDRRRSEEAGFNLHLVKPVKVEALMDFLAAPAAPSPDHISR
jgi:PAS domain S-box-containing protein